LKRVIGTGAGTIFKGSGFYQTDYKNKSTKNNSGDKTENKPSSGEMKDKKADKK
jgi:predicted nucleic acid-binding Zn ribbon protein